MKYKLIPFRLQLLTCALLLLQFCCAEAQQKEPLAIKEAFLKAYNHRSTEVFWLFFDERLNKRNTIEELEVKFDQLRRFGTSIGNMELIEASGDSFTYRCKLGKIFTLQVGFDINRTGKLSKFLITNYSDKSAPKLERNTTSFILPFHGEWYVFWGGKSISQNYHNSHTSMRGAFDFLVMGPSGKSSRGQPMTNADFYAFGQELIAPADARVIYTINDVEDNLWPAMNRAAGGGNMVLLETAQKEYLLMAHLKKGSVAVKEGELVKQGQLLGLCGNSGNSTEPHLHFQTINTADLMGASGAWTYFDKIKVNGQVREDYMPVRSDKISN
ncbi:MAG: M23 family metallopeptidase [Roseivirga sp.]|nr:M23 family metallopeptidase [Roseivirga sp.]